MMATYEITAKMYLNNLVSEAREVAQALTGFADDLEQIDKKYNKEESQETNELQCEDSPYVKVGDELQDWDGDLTYIVTRIYQGVIDGICPDGAVYHGIPLDTVYKTGRRFKVTCSLEEEYGKAN